MIYLEITYVANIHPPTQGKMIKTHVRGFFDTDLHEVSWHF